VVVAAVPWARHDSNFRRSFADQVAWLAVNSCKSAVSEPMRIAWRAVGWICARVLAEASAKQDLFAELRRLGFDEISVRKGQRYLTVVVDQDSGRLVWAHPGRDRQTVEKFLELLGSKRCEQITLVSCDMAGWISGPISERKAGQAEPAKELKGARFALWKNPQNLTERQKLKLEQPQQTNKPLFRASLLAQQLRQIYRLAHEHAIALLDAWLAWARRSRLAPFLKLAKTITEQRPGIEAAIHHSLSNARVEQANTQIRLIKLLGDAAHADSVQLPPPEQLEVDRRDLRRRRLQTRTQLEPPPHRLDQRGRQVEQPGRGRRCAPPDTSRGPRADGTGG